MNQSRNYRIGFFILGFIRKLHVISSIILFDTFSTESRAVRLRRLLFFMTDNRNFSFTSLMTFFSFKKLNGVGNETFAAFFYLFKLLKLILFETFIVKNVIGDALSNMCFVFDPF